MYFINQVFSILFAFSFACVDVSIAKELRSLQVTQQETISMNFNGNPEIFKENAPEIEALFKQSYTSASLTIESAVLDQDDLERRRLSSWKRRLDDGEVKFDFTFFFLISFHCNGCRGGGIFRNDGSRRLLAVDERQTRSEFGQIFNQSLADLNIGADKLNEVTEWEDLEVDTCRRRDFDLLEEIVELRFEGEYNSLINNPQEMAKLERAVKKSYNTMNAPNQEACDNRSRYVTDSSFYSSEPGTGSSFLMRFTLKYDCLGCAALRNREQKLFGRPLDESDLGRGEDPFADFREAELRRNDCVCGRGARHYRAPLKKDFLAALRKFLFIRTEEGKNDYITRVSSGGGASSA